MANRVTSGHAARHALLRGVNALELAVNATLSFLGRTLILDAKDGARTMPTDGVTVASAIDSPDPLGHVGVQMVRGVARIEQDVAAPDMAAPVGRPRFIIAEDVHGEALATMVVNKLRGTFTLTAITAPRYGARRHAILDDIAVLTGGRAITDDLGLKLESITIEDLGGAATVTIDKDTTATNAGHEGSMVVHRVKAMTGSRMPRRWPACS